ncbi:OmpH family outer membrane protein [Hufsiella ginkgonis]|uniref:OmpH family outer membrane protein n=1 Tax=Hufsiella ginkgonis TaxID=2695274 RepID=A0A7K1Y2D5_9SPHI|nr:OmpH family outer membrane protein [Hufsiella ginkgonis]MXV17169.1 OmpH family outer membrane protein [Hufsiella ginkgonis]
MRILSSGFSLFTGLLVVVAVSSCTQNQPKTASPAGAASDKKDGAEIAYINLDTLQSNYAYFADIKAQIEEKQKRAQADLTAKGNAFQQEVARYQQEQPSMSADQRASTEQRLARKQQELQSLNQNAGSAIANESAVENEKLYEKVSTYVKTYAKEKGYKFILTYTKGNPTVLYADERLDITKDVLAGLNGQYKKDKK